MPVKKEVTPEEWKAALLSGKYTRAYQNTWDPDIEGYCCLGVLQELCGNPPRAYEEFPKPEEVPSWMSKDTMHRCAKLNDDALNPPDEAEEALVEAGFGYAAPTTWDDEFVTKLQQILDDEAALRERRKHYVEGDPGDV